MNLPARFEPNKTHIKISALSAAVKHAKKIQDWDSLVEAIEEQLAEQSAFVAWWDSQEKQRGANQNIRDRSDTNVQIIEKQTGISRKQVSRWRKFLKNAEQYGQSLYDAAYAKAMIAAKNHRAGSGEDEWQTPLEYIEAARSVLGSIDLDPATSYAAQRRIKAKHFFTPQQDGLTNEWHGRIWMNPPYSQPLIQKFIDKLIAEAMAERITQAIIVTHNSTDTLWFHRLEQIADRICFTRGRIAFIDPQADRCSPTQGQAFFYCGQNSSKFDEVFTKFGFIR